jgi:hypothetical protein
MRAARVPVPAFAAVAASLLAAACLSTTDAGTATSELVTGFQSVPLAFSNVSSTFAGSESTDSAPWGPPGRPGHGPDGPRGHGDHHGPGPMGFMMGGGLGDPFMGLGFGHGFGHRPPGEGDPFATCSFNVSSGRLECSETHDDLSITRSSQFKDANGAVQSAFDSLTTNVINTKIEVSGTITRRDGDVSTVQHSSDRTVSGLAQGSIQRTVNGTSSGLETTTGTDTTGSFTAVRTAGDTIQTVVIPVTDGKPSFPVSGSVIRSMKVVVTYTGSAATTSTRREVITYDGTDTAKIVITHVGETKSCTMPLPHGHLSCS